MEYFPGYWKRVNDYLLNTKLSGSEIVELGQLFDLGSLSPLPSEVSKIDMVGDFCPKQFIENILRNIIDQRLRLTVSTWRDIRQIFRTVEDNATDSRQKILQILLTATKLDAAEYYSVHWQGAEPEATANHLYERVFLEKSVLSRLKTMLIYESISRAEDDVSLSIKSFLSRPAIVSAFRDSLAAATLNKDDSWICDSINSMNISCTDDLQAFNGFALRDGILLIGYRSHFRKLVTDDGDESYANDKAQIYTAACHETCHYLARCASDDFNFSSPGKGDDERKFDRVVAGKHLELGRNVELLLFNNVQPRWVESSDVAAIDFLKNAKSLTTYPLIQKKPDDYAYLTGRKRISLSFAADLKDEELKFDL